MEKQKRELQGVILEIGGQRDALAKAFVQASTALLGVDCDAELGEARERQKQLLGHLASHTDAVRTFHTEVLRRYLQALGTASDAEHEGRMCNISEICKLGGAFCERLELLCREIKSTALSG